jgi:hypothetical protein
MPIHYQFGVMCFWLFILVGGQLFPQRAPPLSYLGLLFTVLALSVALACIRGLMISLKFRKRLGLPESRATRDDENTNPSI